MEANWVWEKNSYIVGAFAWLADWNQNGKTFIWCLTFEKKMEAEKVGPLLQFNICIDMPKCILKKIMFKCLISRKYHIRCSNRLSPADMLATLSIGYGSGVPLGAEFLLTWRKRLYQMGSSTKSLLYFY